MKLRELDRSKPYAEICGLPGVGYEQDGTRFDGAGKEVAEHHFQAVEERQEKTPDDVLPANTVVFHESPPGVDETAKPLDDMHWTHLKTMLGQYGVEWTNSKDAIAFLKGKKKE